MAPRSRRSSSNGEDRLEPAADRLRRPRAIDGDTLDDLATGERFRPANIVAAEMGYGAQGPAERRQAPRAAAKTHDLIDAATNVTVERLARRDRYGRTIAFVRLDGRDLGETLIAAGLARTLARPPHALARRRCRAHPLARMVFAFISR